MRRLLPLALLLAFAAAAPAADDVAKPYYLRVVLQCGGHRLLTPQFRAQLGRELRDELQAILGKLDRVDVRTSTLGQADPNATPLEKAVCERGLNALDGVSELGEAKSHFVTIDFFDGQYSIAARQYDGPTGFVSPMTRLGRTPDRQFVSRLAARLMGVDLGLSAAVEQSTPEGVMLRLKGATTGTPIANLVKKGEVFAAVRVANGRGVRVSDLLFQAEDVLPDGLCRCSVLAGRKQQQLNFKEFAAVKLGTTVAPLRFRLNDPDGGAVTNLTVSAGPTESTLEPLALRGELYTSNRPINHAALVRVMRGAVVVARYPVELLTEAPIARTPELLEQSSALLDLVEQWRDTRAQIVEVGNVHRANLVALSNLVKAVKNTEALTRAKLSLDFLKTRTRELRAQQVKLHADSIKANRSFPEDADCDKALKDLEKSDGSIVTLIGDLEKALQIKSDQQSTGAKVQSFSTDAGLLYEQADYEGVLKNYQEILKLDAGQTKIADEMKKLKAEWDKRDQQATNFIYKIWPNQMTAQDIDSRLATAKQMFDRCKRAGDKLTARKLKKVNTEVLPAHLLKQLEPIKESASKDDQETIKLIISVKDKITAFTDEINAFLGV